MGESSHVVCVLLETVCFLRFKKSSSSRPPITKYSNILCFCHQERRVVQKKHMKLAYHAAMQQVAVQTLAKFKHHVAVKIVQNYAFQLNRQPHFNLPRVLYRSGPHTHPSAGGQSIGVRALLSGNSHIAGHPAPCVSHCTGGNIK